MCEAPKKSFCYFLLLQKVKSPFLYQPQLTSDSTNLQSFCGNFTQMRILYRKILHILLVKIIIKHF